MLWVGGGGTASRATRLHHPRCNNTCDVSDVQAVVSCPRKPFFAVTFNLSNVTEIKQVVILQSTSFVTKFQSNIDFCDVIFSYNCSALKEP